MFFFYISVCFFPSLSLSVCFCLFLFMSYVSVRFCTYLSFFVNLCILLNAYVCFCLLLPISVCYVCFSIGPLCTFSPFLSVLVLFIRFCQFISVSVNMAGLNKCHCLQYGSGTTRSPWSSLKKNPCL